jgi:hypothetical protein
VSSIVPGPKKKLEEDITAARAGAKPLDASDLNPSAPRPEKLTGLDDWPETLRATIEAEHTRVTALETNRRQTADRAVPALVHGLDTLLSELADHLNTTKPGLFTKPTTPEPNADIAALLGIPPEDLPTTPSRADYRTAQRTIKQLRSHLKDLETTPDHARLTRLTTFLIRLSVVLEAAPAPTTTLIPTALTRFTNNSPDPQRNATFPEKLTTWQQTRQSLTTP